MERIQIRKCPIADTRTCDYTQVTEEQLFEASEQHIEDVREGLHFFTSMLHEAAAAHDVDKLHAVDEFHADFVTGFEKTEWWDNHRKIHRHHLNYEDGCPEDVNLVDVLEYIVDCVMSGMARRGEVYPVTLDHDVLAKAFQNTVELLTKNVELLGEFKEPLHVYEWLDMPSENEGERLAKEWLDRFTRPAYDKYMDGTDEWLSKRRLTVEWNGVRYQCVGASRMGDVWLKAEGSQSFYDHRVNVEELSNWERKDQES